MTYLLLLLTGDVILTIHLTFTTQLIMWLNCKWFYARFSFSTYTYDVFTCSFPPVVPGCLSEFLLTDFPCWANQNTEQGVTSSPSILINLYSLLPLLPPHMSSSLHPLFLSMSSSLSGCQLLLFHLFFPATIIPLLFHYSLYLFHPKWFTTNHPSLNPNLPLSFSPSLAQLFSLCRSCPSYTRLPLPYSISLHQSFSCCSSP